MSNDKPTPKPTPKPAPKPAVEATEPVADTGSTDRARRREAALRRLRKTNMSKRTAAAWGATAVVAVAAVTAAGRDRKSTRLNSSHVAISYAVFCLKKKKITDTPPKS